MAYRHGTQGILDAASNQTLEAEFGTSKEEDVVKQILEKGSVQEVDVRYPTTSSIKSSFIQPPQSFIQSSFCLRQFLALANVGI